MGSSDWPAVYEIRFVGALDDQWSSWFGGMEIRTDGNEATLTGTLSDQPALHGVLDRIRDLGLSITSVRRFSPEEE